MELTLIGRQEDAVVFHIETMRAAEVTDAAFLLGSKGHIGDL